MVSTILRLSPQGKKDNKFRFYKVLYKSNTMIGLLQLNKYLKTLAGLNGRHL